jgi:hypothetical protein
VCLVRVECSSITPFGVTGGNLVVQGEKSVSFEMCVFQFEHRFLVSQLPTTAVGILGVNFLTPRQAVLDLGDCKLTLYRNHSPRSVAAIQHRTCSSPGARVENCGLIPRVFISHTVPQVSKDKQVKPYEGKKVPIMLKESESWSVASKNTVVLKPRAKHVVHGKLLGDNVENSPSLVRVEPALIPIEGIRISRVLACRGSASGEPHQQVHTK